MEQLLNIQHEKNIFAAAFQHCFSTNMIKVEHPSYQKWIQYLEHQKWL